MFKALSDNYQQVFVAVLPIKMCVYFIIITNALQIECNWQQKKQ